LSKQPLNSFLVFLLSASKGSTGLGFSVTVGVGVGLGVTGGSTVVVDGLGDGWSSPAACPPNASAVGATGVRAQPVSRIAEEIAMTAKVRRNRPRGRVGDVLMEAFRRGGGKVTEHPVATSTQTGYLPKVNAA
jgi:hypothetical protein